MFIISVYLPSCSGCTDNFNDSLDQLKGILMLLPAGADIVIMGDFNADLGYLGGPMSDCFPNEQGKILNKYLSCRKFVCTHLHLCYSHPIYTFESEAHDSMSTIDHILCPSHMLNMFSSSLQLKDHPLNNSDHIPPSATLMLPSHPSTVYPSSTKCSSLHSLN